MQAATPPPEPQVVNQPQPEHGPRTVVLEDGTFVQIKPGVEPGFMHCCGDSDYMIEVDCRDVLMRCYRRARDGWKQTYGKHCKQSLGQECYLHTCYDVCEAVSTFSDLR